MSKTRLRQGVETIGIGKIGKKGKELLHIGKMIKCPYIPLYILHTGGVLKLHH